MNVLGRFAVAFLLCVFAPPGHAENHALLVGVSNYPTLPAMSLYGPANDVELMRTVLLRKGFAAGNVQALADGVKGAGDPTRASILKALDGIVAKARAGDFVMLFFAGHGSQQPQDRAAEAVAQLSEFGLTA